MRLGIPLAWPKVVATSVAILAAGCGSSTRANTVAEKFEPPPGFFPEKRFAVKVDPRVELFSILFRLAGVKEYTLAPDTDYTRAVDGHFEACRGHPAVQASRDLHTGHSVGYNAPMDLAVHLDAAASLKPAVPFAPHPRRLDRRWEKAPVESYLGKARRFVEECRFVEFMASQRKYHERVETRLAAALEGVDLIPWFDGFFGPKPDVRVVLVPGLLNGPNGYGSSVILPDGREIISPVLGLGNWLGEGMPEYKDREGLVSYLFHEIGHAYVNVVMEAHAGLLEPGGRQVYALVEDEMRRQAYGNWMTVLHESCVRAATVLFMRDRYGQASAARAVGRNESRSFLWTGPLVELLDRYRQERHKYEDFKAFLPEVASFFELWAKLPPERRVPPFRGPMNAALGRRKNALLVAPLVVEGNQASKKARRFVEKIHEVLFSKRGITLLAADKVSGRDENGRTLILYGTPESNPVLARMLGKFGWQVGKNGIAIGARRFEGTGLVLIACQPHPGDGTKVVTVYAAGRDEDLVEINSLFHGPTDWIVARRGAGGAFGEVASGYFPKNLDGTWLPLGEDR